LNNVWQLYLQRLVEEERTVFKEFANETIPTLMRTSTLVVL